MRVHGLRGLAGRSVAETLAKLLPKRKDPEKVTMKDLQQFSDLEFANIFGSKIGTLLSAVS